MRVGKGKKDVERTMSVYVCLLVCVRAAEITEVTPLLKVVEHTSMGIRVLKAYF